MSENELLARVYKTLCNGYKASYSYGRILKNQNESCPNRNEMLFYKGRNKHQKHQVSGLSPLQRVKPPWALKCRLPGDTGHATHLQLTCFLICQTRRWDSIISSRLPF